MKGIQIPVHLNPQLKFLTSMRRLLRVANTYVGPSFLCAYISILQIILFLHPPKPDLGRVLVFRENLQYRDFQSGRTLSENLTINPSCIMKRESEAQRTKWYVKGQTMSKTCRSRSEAQIQYFSLHSLIPFFIIKHQQCARPQAAFGSKAVASTDTELAFTQRTISQLVTGNRITQINM